MKKIISSLVLLSLMASFALATSVSPSNLRLTWEDIGTNVVNVGWNRMEMHNLNVNSWGVFTGGALMTSNAFNRCSVPYVLKFYDNGQELKYSARNGYPLKLSGSFERSFSLTFPSGTYDDVTAKYVCPTNSAVNAKATQVIDFTVPACSSFWC